MGSNQIETSKSASAYEINEKENNIVSNEKKINEKENINSNEKILNEKQSTDLSEAPTNEDTNSNETNKSEDTNSNELNGSGDANLNESNVNEVKPLKKDLYSNLLSNYLPKYSFCYDELELRPEYKTEKYSYFFSIGKLVDYLNKELNQALRDYNLLLEPYDLIDFSKKEQKEKYNKKIGAWPTVKRKLALLTHPEQDSEEMKKKAKITAFFLSQFNTENKKHNDNNPYYIAYFDFIDGKFHFENDPFFGEANSRLSLEIDNDNYDDYIQRLYEEFISLENSISLSLNNQDKNKKEIFMNYLIRFFDNKIKKIEHSLNKPTNLKNIRSKINELAMKYCYYQHSEVKFFYDLTFEILYIIKDQPNEKEALVVKGANLDSFKKTFEEEFAKLNGFAISNEDETQENDNDYIKKCDKNIKFYEGKSTESEKEIKKMKEDNLHKSIDSIISIAGVINNNVGEENNKKKITNEDIVKGGDAVKNIADIYTNEKTIDRIKLNEENRKKQLIYWKKLKNIKLLLNNIENILKENVEFKAIIISQKIDKNNDSFITKIIY